MQVTTTYSDIVDRINRHINWNNDWFYFNVKDGTYRYRYDEITRILFRGTALYIEFGWGVTKPTFDNVIEIDMGTKVYNIESDVKDKVLNYIQNKIEKAVNESRFMIISRLDKLEKLVMECLEMVINNNHK